MNNRMELVGEKFNRLTVIGLNDTINNLYEKGSRIS